MVFSRGADLFWPFLGKRHVADVFNSSNLYPWEDQYPLGLNLCPLREYRFRSWIGIGSDGVLLMDTWCPCLAVVDCCPDFFIPAFSSCVVAIFAMSSATCPYSSEIVFVSNVTNILSAFVVVARFASARVWSCYISVKFSAFACAACTCAMYPSVLEILEDILFSLKAQTKQALKFPHVLSFFVLRIQSRQSSWWRPHLSMFA